MRRVARWLDAMPHPPLAIEIAPDRVAVARWSEREDRWMTLRSRTCRAGAIVPSAVEANIVNAAAVKSAITKVCERLRAKDEDVALILPTPSFVIFVQHFEEFPRSQEEADPDAALEVEEKRSLRGR